MNARIQLTAKREALMDVAQTDTSFSDVRRSVYERHLHTVLQIENLPCGRDATSAQNNLIASMPSLALMNRTHLDRR